MLSLVELARAAMPYATLALPCRRDFPVALAERGMEGWEDGEWV